MKSYKHIFFDLDHTLYDFDKSTKDTFLELHSRYGLAAKGVEPFDDFYREYKKVNEYFWELYRKDKVEKEFLNVERFHITFKKFGLNDRNFAERFANEYLAEAPLKNALFPGAIQVLEKLSSVYHLHIITNGFKEVQTTKLKANRLEKYFKTVTVSEEVGVRKPALEIFEYAMRKADASPGESIMIGDSLEVDIEGAANAGMDQVFFNYNNQPHNGNATYHITSLKELLSIL